MKTFKEIEVVQDRQGGAVREVIVDRAPGPPQLREERIYVENFGECIAYSGQPAGRDNFRLVVRRA